MGRPLPGILRLLEWEATRDPLTGLGALRTPALGATLVRVGCITRQGNDATVFPQSVSPDVTNG